MDAKQWFLSILGVLFIIAFFFERHVTRERARRDQAERQRRPWWQEPPNDSPEGDY